MLLAKHGAVARPRSQVHAPGTPDHGQVGERGQCPRTAADLGMSKFKFKKCSTSEQSGKRLSVTAFKTLQFLKTCKCSRVHLAVAAAAGRACVR